MELPNDIDWIDGSDLIVIDQSPEQLVIRGNKGIGPACYRRRHVQCILGPNACP